MKNIKDMKSILLLPLIYAICLIFFGSCTQSSKNNKASSTDIVDIFVDPSTVKDGFDVADYFEEQIEIIVLETNEESLIGRIGKIIFQDEKYYILDSSTNSVLIFDKQGRYISKLSKVGQGPSDYTSLESLVVVDGNMWVSDTNVRSLIAYNNKFELIKRINLWNYLSPQDMVSIDDKIYIADNLNGFNTENILLGVYEIDNKDKDNVEGLFYGPRRPNEAASFSKHSQLSLSNDTCLCIYSYNDTIMQITGKDVKPKYKISFKERYEDKPYPIEDYLKGDNIIKGIEDIKQISDNILLGYIDSGEFRTAQFNKSTRQTQVYRTLINSNFGNINIFQYAAFIDDDYLVTYYDPEVIIDEAQYFIPDLKDVKDISVRTEIKQKISSLTYNSNPVIVRFKFK